MLLISPSRHEMRQVKYHVNIFNGNFIKPQDYLVQVTYGTVQKKSKMCPKCSWNEKIVFYGKFHSLNEKFYFEVFTYGNIQWKLKCVEELQFSDMSWKIDGECK